MLRLVRNGWLAWFEQRWQVDADADRDLRSHREGGELSVPLYVQKYRVRSGEQTITVTVPRKPARVLICPYHLLIDRDPADTIAPLRTRE